MSVSAVKGILWMAVAIAVALAMAALSPAFDPDVSLALFVGGCVLFVVALLWYRRAVPMAEAREEERQAEQLVVLKQQVAYTREPVVVKASSGLWLLMLSVCLLIFFGHQAYTIQSIGLIAMFAGNVLVTVIVALILVPRVGKPALTIQHDGLAMPIYGLLRWEEIESIGLQRYTTRGATTHTIDIYVPQLEERESRLHPLLKMSRAFLRRSSPNFIVLHLVNPSLPSRLVHALCYELWKERTGKARVWNSSLSEQHIEQMRRTEDRLEGLKRAGAEMDPAKAMQLLDEIDKEFGTSSAKQKAEKRLSPEETARRDELIAEMRKMPGDPAALRRLIEKRANTRAREMGTTVAIVGVVLAVLIIGALRLFGE